MKNFDFFDNIVGIKYSNSWRYKTIPGAILSIITFFLCLGILIFYLSKFIKRDDIKTSIETYKYWSPPLLDISSSNFPFAVLMKYSDEFTFRPDLFNIEIIYTTVNASNKNIIVRSLSIVPCEKTYFIDNVEEFDEYGLSGALCADTNDVQIQGSSFNSILSYLTIQFNVCSNNTQCLSQADLEATINAVKPRAFFFFQNSIYNTKQPFIKKILSYVYIDLTFYDFKESQLFLTEEKLLIEDNYLTDSALNIDNVMLDSYRDLVSVRSPNNDTALNIHLLPSNSRSVMNISYMKLSELLSSLGGFLNIAIMIPKLLAYYIGQYAYQFEFLNSMFDYQISNTSDNNNDDKIISSDNDGYTSKNVIDSTNKNKIIIFDKSGFTKQPKRVKNLFKSKDLVGVMCGKCLSQCAGSILKKYKLFKLIASKTEKLQNFSYIIKKAQEVDLLKYILFNENQLFLYNNLPKPTLYVSKDNIRVINAFKKEDLCEGLITNNFKYRLNEVMSKLRQQETLTTLDDKLIRAVNCLI
jgi:hypothetical protein